MSAHEPLVVHESELRVRVLPLLRERVFHVTSRERLQSMYDDGFIRSNRDASFGNTYPQSAVNVGRRNGFVCLFDLRSQTEEAVQHGLGCFYFLAPPPLGDDLAFLLLAPAVYSQLVLWDDIKLTVEIGAFHIPDLECWFPTDIPMSAIERVELVHVVRRPAEDPDPAVVALAAAMRADLARNAKRRGTRRCN